MNKFLILLFICFIQVGFGQISDFSFKVNSLTDSYDSETQKYIRKYWNDEKSVNIILSENEMNSIRESFEKVDFKTFPLKLKCDTSIDVLPSFDEIIQMTDNNKIYVSINSNCIKVNSNEEKMFNEIWNLIFSILDNRNDIKKLKVSDIEVL